MAKAIHLNILMGFLSTPSYPLLKQLATYFQLTNINRLNIIKFQILSSYFLFLKRFLLTHFLLFIF